MEISSGIHHDGLRIEVRENVAAVMADLNYLQRQMVPEATAAALNKCAEQARTAAARQIAQAKDMPVREIRARFSIRKAAAYALVAELRFRVTRVLAHHLGKPQQLKKGAKVRKHFFPGAFVAHSNWAGGDTIFKRVGKERLPIHFQSVALEPEASRIALNQVRNVVAAKWHDIFTNQLNFRLGKKGLL